MLKKIKDYINNRKNRKWMAIFAFVLVVTIVVANTILFSGEVRKEEKLSNFIQIIKSDDIKNIKGEVAIYELSRVIEYTYKDEKMYVKYPGSSFLTYESNVNLLEILNKNKITYNLKADQVSILDILFKVTPFIFFGFLAYLLMRQMGILSNFKVHKAENMNVTFDDIAGYESVKNQLIEYVDYLNNSVDFEKYDIQPSKGILLVGAPGMGKTLFARAVASESKTPFFYLSGADIEDKFIGSGANNVRELFKAARKEADKTGKVIIFIDELDAVGLKREMRTVPETNQTINKILTEIDGFKEDNRILIFGATNHLESLDTALTRAGRFDQIIHIDPPNLRERDLIISLYLKKKGNVVSPEVYERNYSYVLAQQTEGFCNADFKNLVNEAAKFAKRKDKEHIDIECLRSAYTKIVAGLEKEQHISEEDLRIIAYHEAGHAVAQIITNPNRCKSVAYITVTPYGQSLGHVSPVSDNKVLLKRSELRNAVKVVLAGRAVEEKILNGDFTTGASSDLQKANKAVEDYIFKYGMTDDVQNIFIEKLDSNSEQARTMIISLLKELYEETKSLVDTHFDMIEVIAEHLLKHQSIDQHELETVLRDTTFTK